MKVTRRPIFFSRPADGSLEAYKQWITSVARAFGAHCDDAADEPSKERWLEGWRRFWGVESQAPEASSERSGSDI